MDEKNVNLLNQLTSILNRHHINDTSYSIALYLLANYNKVNKITLEEIEENCFVSKSSIRRFCLRLGYENFRDLKREFNVYNRSVSNYYNFVRQEGYREWLDLKLITMVLEEKERFSQSETEKISDKIHSCGRLIFLVSDTTSDAVFEFQKEMVYCGKIVYVISENYKNNLNAMKINKNDYVWIISISGVFARHIGDILKNYNCETVLLTANRRDVFDFSKIYHLSREDHADERFFYSRYALKYSLDLIYSAFIRKFGQ